MKTNNNELVSAIITTYKRDLSVLKRAIESILKQTYKNIELIVVNDYPNACENNTNIAKMIDEYKALGSKINYIVVSKNGGACKARNIGIQASKGNYIGFLDDDDEWEPEKIESMLEQFRANPEIAIVYSNAYIVNEINNSIKLYHKVKMPSGNIFKKLFEWNIIGSNSFPLIKKSAIEEVNGFNENMPAMQDLELYMRICKNNKVVYINKPLSRYHLYEGERITKNSRKRIEAYNLLFKEFKQEMDSDKTLLYYMYRKGVQVYSINRNHRTALKLLINEIKLMPTKFKTNTKDLFSIIKRFFFTEKNI